MITTIKNLLKKSTDPFPSNHSKFLSTASDSRHREADNDVSEQIEPQYHLHSRLEVREDGDTRVLIDNRNGSITACNPTAWALLNQLLKGATRPQLIAALTREFQVGTEQATMDLNNFFKHLNSMGCIREDD